MNIQNTYKKFLVETKKTGGHHFGKTSNSKRSRVSGYTLIEVMVASGLFVVVMVFGIAVLISVNKTHKTADTFKDRMDSISFALEDMTRNVRLATSVHCPAEASAVVPMEGQSCESSSVNSGEMGSLSFSFEGLDGDPTANDDDIVYWLVKEEGGSLEDGYLVKSREGYSSSYDNDVYKRVTPPGVKIDLTRSGFTVTSAEEGDGQTKVIIRLSGAVEYQQSTAQFNFQTTVSPRNIDS